MIQGLCKAAFAAGISDAACDDQINTDFLEYMS